LTTPLPGDRQLVREAIASYFGGTLQTSDAGIYYQGGSLTSLGLGTAFPYKVKPGAPDTFYTEGQSSGTGWGAVLTVNLQPVTIRRQAMGGKASGFRMRRYMAVCNIEVISYAPHLETAEQGLDNLVDGLINLIYADRTLGSTNPALYPNPPYFGGRLIEQAGEGPNAVLDIGESEFTVDEDRGRARGGIAVTFNADNWVQS
jgi:hypothetical protein